MTRLPVKLCAALLVCVPVVSAAATDCAFTAVAPVNFGAYDVLATAANDNGVGMISIDCKGAGIGTFEVMLSTGYSLNYTTRVMQSGANRLDYNLYTSADRSVVWGDGTGQSQLMTVTKNKPTTLSVFGHIPAGQDVAIGMYSDMITVIVYF